MMNSFSIDEKVFNNSTKKKELTQHSEFIPYDILLIKLLKKFTFIVIPKPISVVICKKVFLAIALIV